MKTIHQFIIIIIISLTYLSAQSSSGITVNARLDSAHLIMGYKTFMHVEVVKNKDRIGHFPILEGSNSSGYVGVNGDSVELSTHFSSDTVNLSPNRIQINYHIPVQSFDSGFYHLPPMMYVDGSDTILSNRVVLKVLPIPVNPNDSIAPMTDVAIPSNISVFDSLPDIIIDYWWAFIIGVFIIITIIWIILRYRKYGKTLMPTPPEIPPYEEAIHALERLKQQDLWQTGQEKEYYTRLLDIFRRYLSRRYQIAAPEMTSSQLINTIKNDARVSSFLPSISKLLDIADLVKFARIRPLPQENIDSYKTVSEFVESTRPESDVKSDDRHFKDNEDIDVGLRKEVKS